MSRGGGGHGGNGGGGSGHGNGSGHPSPDSGNTPTSSTDPIIGGGYKNEPDADDRPPEGSHESVTHTDNGVAYRESDFDGTYGYEVNAEAYAREGTAYAGAEGEVFAGPVSANLSGYARADAHFDSSQVQLGAEAQVKLEDSVDVAGVGVGLSASARAAAGIDSSNERTQFGAEAAVNAEAKVGSSGNELTVGVGAGFGGGVEIIHGEDSDHDGQFEIGGSISLKFIGGGSLGFRFEPEALLERGKELFGMGNNEAHMKEISPMQRFEAAVEMKRTDDAIERLHSLR